MPQFSTQERARIPIRYMSRLFSAGNDEIVAEVYRKLFAVRVHMRSKKVGDVPEAKHAEALTLGAHDARRGRGDLPADCAPDGRAAVRAAHDDPRGRRRGARRPVHAQVGGRLRIQPGSGAEVVSMAVCDTRAQVLLLLARSPRVPGPGAAGEGCRVPRARRATPRLGPPSCSARSSMSWSAPRRAGSRSSTPAPSTSTRPPTSA